ncbi:tyrosine--tRNA ligase, partial [Candidatus Uhrbacteria bacterium]|nr:tyrosine--tRNA ligase [Candidatus Uhrbacteria bacterium]
PHFGQKPQDIFTMQLLEGLDGRKMSKTYGNTVNLLDAPEEKYGKIMSLRDDLMEKYFALCTRVPTHTITNLLKANPLEAKMRLSSEIVELYHGKAAAKRAEEQFVKTFQKKELPDFIRLQKLHVKQIDLASLLVQTFLAQSKTIARKLIADGAVEVDGATIRNPAEIITLSASEDTIIKKGKRHFVRVRVTA